MSADNWRYCPACYKNAKKELREKEEKIREAYGVVSAEEYVELLQERILDIEDILEETLREDYSIGMSVDGEFEVDYRCHCSKCGFNFDYKKTIEAKI